MSSIAVLINVCNHREQALECLAGCYRQFDTLAAQDESLSFSIYVHDDAGTDGLLEAVRERFPQVHLMHSDSVQYWCTGLRMLWEEAAREDFDFYIWLDYNLRLEEGCFARLLETSAFLRHKALLAGSVRDVSGSLRYGGRTRKGVLIEPDATIPVPCRFLDGHLVLVPRACFRTLGFIDTRFLRVMGDYDYSNKAFKAGVPRLVAPGTLAQTARSFSVPVWKNPQYSLVERIYSFFYRK